MAGGFDLRQLRPSRAEVIRLLSDLVAVDSVNPSLVPGAAGEAQIGAFVRDWLREAGWQADTAEAAPGRPNAVGRLLGPGGGRSIMLNAHVDTVTVEGMTAPFDPRVEGDRLYGRGAYDMKGSLAAIMLAARALARMGGAAGDVMVTAVADEEYASLGTQAIVASMKADAAIVTEPTGLDVCTAHKGFAWLSIETRGRAAHGSRPELGVDAIAHTGRVLSRLEILGAELRARPAHPLLGHGSVHASLIEGGQELSSYPNRCRLQIERRTVPGESAETVSAEIQEILAALQRADPVFHADAEMLLWRDPFEVDPNEAVVRSVRESAKQTLGRSPQMYGDTPWMDAALLAAAGIPTVVFGPGGAGAHAAEEWVSIEQVALCAEILARSVLTFCSE